MEDAIEESKRIMIFFIKNNFGEDIHARATELLNSINIDIDSDEKTAEVCAAYCSSENYRSIIHSYAKRIIFEKLS